MEELWYTKKPEDVVKSFSSDPKNGLPQSHVEKHREKWGTNTLPKRSSDPWWVILGRQFASPLVYILLVGSGISFYVQEFLDALVILSAVLLNTIIGFIQEYKANQSLSIIQESVVFQTNIIRGGEQKRVLVEELVPGDVMMLEAGDRIPADGRIILNADLETNEASLTGESLSIKKTIRPLKKGANVGDRTNMLFMGTTVVGGSGKAVVVATGLKTELGKIAELIQETREELTPLQEQLKKLAQGLALLFVVLSTLLVVVGVVQGRPLVELFVTAIAVAVAAIPEGLLIALTIILAVGMQRILKQNAVIKRLVAAETLGSVSVVCTDKTGTLTKAEMAPTLVLTDAGVYEDFSEVPSAELLWKAASLCNNAFFEEEEGVRKFVGDPTESALLKGAEKAGFPVEHTRSQFERVYEVPFDSKKKYMAVLTTDKKRHHIWLKGAPEIILDRCTHTHGKKRKQIFTPAAKKRLTKLIDAQSKKGLRLIAIAHKPTTKSKRISNGDLEGLVLLGVVALKDPLRPDAKGVIKRAVASGIRPVLITGDHKRTAQAIMHELDLPSEDKHTITGEELDEMDEKEFKKVLKKTWIYARVAPKHKVRIVQAWREAGETVAMIGDGVNDAPSLKAADIGLALGSGTDVAKETADIVLLDDNFKVVTDAIKTGRLIFQNIRNVTTYLLTDAFTEIILIGGALVVGFPLPILAGQILWINLLEDTFPALALAFEKGSGKEIDGGPRKRNEPLFNREMKTMVFVVGLLTDFILLGLFFYYQMHFTDIDYVRTIIFAALGFDSILIIYSMRSLTTPIWRMNPFSNKLITLSVLVGFAMIAVAVYVPFIQKLLKTTAIRPVDWGLLLLLGVLEVVMVEIVKWIFVHGKHTQNGGGKRTTKRTRK